MLGAVTSRTLELLPVRRRHYWLAPRLWDSGIGLRLLRRIKTSSGGLEDQPNVCELLVDSLLLQVACPCISKVGNKLDEAAHIGAVGSGAAEEAGSSGGSHVEIPAAVWR